MTGKEFIKAMVDMGFKKRDAKKAAKTAIIMHGSYEGALEAYSGIVKAVGNMTKSLVDVANVFSKISID